MPRVLVIGLDGATFRVLRPLMEDGRLPFLSELVTNGASGDLRTTFPPVTAPAWASFMTGKNPGKHGVYEFLDRDAGCYDGMPVNSRMVRAETLWSIVSRHGKSVAVINVPLTYPHEPINGLMLGDFLTPAGATDFSYPPSLGREIESRYGKYPLYHRQVYSRRNVTGVLEELYRIHEYYARVSLDLMQRRNWDLFMTYFPGTDRLQHELWHVFDPNHPQHTRREAAQFREKTLAFYERIDETIRTLVESAGEDTITIIVSDHGFGPIHRFINVNAWLMDCGYLRLKHTVSSRLRYLTYRSGLTPAWLYRMAMRVGMANLRLARGMSKRISTLRVLEHLMLSLADVDWNHTRAYSQGNYGQIFLNLAGREPHGIVPLGDYEEVLQQLRQDLERFKDPLTGEAIVSTVLKRDDIYHGDYADHAPDICFLPAEGYKALGTLAFTSSKVVEPVFGNTGDHRMDGILVVSGAGIRKAHCLDEARITDLAPTILHLLQLPVERDMDGKVLEGALLPHSIAQHKITYTDSSVPAARAPADAAYTETEAAELRERLAALGYWG